MIKVIFKCSLTVITLLFPYNNVEANDTLSLSTSRFVPVEYYHGKDNLIKTCSGKKAGFAQNYVSIGINKLTVNKEDSMLRRVFNRNRRAFGVSNLKGNFQNQLISISRVGSPVALNGSNSSIDMGVEWGMLERIPWVLKNASIEIKLGYAADSTTDSMIEAFSGVTSAIPDYTLTTSLATGFAITNAIDNLLFGSDRAINLLNAQRDIPLFASQLCEGHYAIFSAENRSLYEKYYNGNVIWTGNDLQYDEKPINDVSYAVVSVRVSDNYYDTVESSLDDNSRIWASKYRDIRMLLFEFILISDENLIDELVRRIRGELLEARTLLSSDLNLIEREKHAIHDFVLKDFTDKLNIARSRIDSRGRVTVSNTENAITMALNNSDTYFGADASRMAQLVLSNPKHNIKQTDEKFDNAFKNAIRRTEAVLSIK